MRRQGWNSKLRIIVVSYTLNPRLPKRYEEPKCVLRDAAQSHIICN